MDDGSKTWELCQNEIDVMSKLDHPNVVKQIIYGDGTHKKKSKSKQVKFIALEICGGGELFDFIAHSGPFSERNARYYFK